MRPPTAWLHERGVTVHTRCHITDLACALGHRSTTVKRISLTRDGRDEQIEVAPEDLVLVTNGPMTDSTSLGSHFAAPPPAPPAHPDPTLGRSEGSCYARPRHQPGWPTSTSRSLERPLRLAAAPEHRGRSDLPARAAETHRSRSGRRRNEAASAEVRACSRTRPAHRQQRRSDPTH
ncbi:oleate hydratase [Streptomyces canus]|uniref:oleate hydratase n=1 Tax=Streptomyces canus TaxID=58343 RepID=UPI003CFA75FC